MSLRDPRIRFYGAVGLFIFSLIGGIHSVVWIAETPYEKILIGISWGAMILTAIDIMATTDVRKEQ